MYPAEANQLARKVKNMLSKGFAELGPFKIRINFFLVLKIERDI